MLILSRKSKERISIGNDIVITVLRTHAGRVSIGIEAPKTMPVLRTELVERAGDEEAHQ